MVRTITRGAVVLALLLGLVGLAGPVGPAGSGPIIGELQVTKAPVGDVPPGTTFEVAVDCADGTSSTTLTFPAEGGTETIAPPQPTTCTVTETADGGADSVSYGCVDIPRGAVCNGAQEADLAGGDAVITVTNTFDPPPPPEPPAPEAGPVTADPGFTG